MIALRVSILGILASSLQTSTIALLPAVELGRRLRGAAYLTRRSSQRHATESPAGNTNVLCDPYDTCRAAIEEGRRGEKVKSVALFLRAYQKKQKQVSRYVGVQFDGRRRKWRSSIRVAGSTVSLGFFDDEEEAAHAYDARAGELGKPVNFPTEFQRQAIKGQAAAKQMSQGGGGGARSVTLRQCNQLISALADEQGEKEPKASKRRRRAGLDLAMIVYATLR